MANWNLPTTTSLYTAFVVEVKNRDEDVATQFASLPTNPITDMVRFNRTNSRWETYNGATWQALDTEYAINVTNLNGQLGDYYRNAGNLNAGTLPAGRFTDTSHGNRSGGALHSAVTTSTNGFMSATDKTKLNGIESGATADLTAAEILTLIKTVDGPGSGLDADTLDGLTSSDYARSNSAQTISGVHTHTVIPAFNGGTSGATAPFTVDSNTKVTNLNADLLDGFSEADFIRATSADTVSASTTWSDSNSVYLGTGNDMRLWHNATNSYIDNSTGSLNIRNILNSGITNLQTRDSGGTDRTGISIGAATPEVKLYYGGAQKVKTTNTGLDITGTLTVSDTTKVTNLNSDLLDGITSASFVRRDSVGTAITVNHIYTGVPSFTNNFTVGSTTKVTNLNSDLLDGYSASETSTASTICARDSSGDINARLFKSEFDTTNASVNYIMTQVDTATNNYIRPSTPAQFRAAVTDGVYQPTGSYLTTATTFAGDVTGTYNATVVGNDSHTHTGNTISALNAADTTAGVFAAARMGNGTASSANYLRGDRVWASLSVPTDNTFENVWSGNSYNFTTRGSYGYGFFSGNLSNGGANTVYYSALFANIPGSYNGALAYAETGAPNGNRTYDGNYIGYNPNQGGSGAIGFTGYYSPRWRFVYDYGSSSYNYKAIYKLRP